MGSTSHRARRGLIAAFCLSALGFASIEPFLVVWGHGVVGLAGSAAGLLFVAQAAGEVCGGLAGGLVADRLGGRQVLLASTVGMALGYGALAFVHVAWLALAVIFAAGLFEAAFHPTALALAAEMTAPDRRAGVFGVMRAAANLGTILGPLAGAAVVAGAAVADVFALCAALLVASGLVVFAAAVGRGAARVSLEEEAEETRAAVPGVKAIARDRRLGLLVAGGGLLAITLAWWEADGLTAIGAQRPFGTGGFSLMLALGALLVVVFQIPVTRLTRGRPVGELLFAGAVLQALGLAAFAASAGGIAVVAVAVGAIAFGEMLYGPNLHALASELAPPGHGTAYQAALSTTNDVGMAAGPASGLALVGGAGAVAMWLLALPLGLLAGVMVARGASWPARRVRRRLAAGTPAAVEG